MSQRDVDSEVGDVETEAGDVEPEVGRCGD